MTTVKFDFSNINAIVTGGGTGIGQAVAVALAEAGASVLVNDLNPDRADTTTQLIVDAGGTAQANQADVCNRFQAAAMIEQAREAFGKIDILINTAGTYRGGDLFSLDEWDWRRLVDVNLTGAFFCTQLMGRVMADQGSGVIINIGYDDTYPDGIGYIASKHGVVGLTRQAALEFAPHNIRVNAVCMAGIVDEELPELEEHQLPLNYAGTPQDVANAILFLCSDSASFITGQTLVVDGGASLT